MFSILKPTKQSNCNKTIFGFDIETYGQKNTFYCGSVWHEKDNFRKTFFERDEMIEHFKLKRFKNSLISASNLQFDFFGLFEDKDEVINFKMLWRGSDMLFAKTYVYNSGFNHSYRKKQQPTTFIDTMNYAKMSVKNLGELIGTAKLESPACLGRLPESEEEKDELLVYNMRDSEISARGLQFLYDSFTALGATPKNTLASTSMSLFKNHYLKDEYFRHEPDVLLEQFKGYYGGRTEAFMRGKIEDYNYYDINSLYPFVMRKNEYPDPNTLRRNRINTMDYINTYEGMSLVTVDCPFMEYPYLPLRYDNKLMFPIGKFTSWYSHIEIRRAVDLGYNIIKVHKTYYYKENCEPFREFVDDLYKRRMELKAEGSNMEYVTKILMNSLYGKFGQKFIDRDNWIPFNLSMKELEKYDMVERFGNFIRVKQAYTEPSSFCIPIWAIYVTSYARTELHNLIRISRPAYVDTDSLITTKKMLTGSELGKLKLEMTINEGVIIKPKMYAFKGRINGKPASMAKVKGLGRRINYEEFMELAGNPTIAYEKIAKFKESMRRKLSHNEIISMSKTFDLEDTKRVWKKPYDENSLQSSQPMNTRNFSEKLIKPVELPFVR